MFCSPALCSASQRLIRRSSHLGRSLEVKEGVSAEVLDVKDEEAKWEEEKKREEKVEEMSCRKKKVTEERAETS